MEPAHHGLPARSTTTSHPVRRLAVVALVPLALGGTLAACGSDGPDTAAVTTTPAATTGLVDGATTPAGTVGGRDASAVTGTGDAGTGHDHAGSMGSTDSEGGAASGGSASGSSGSAAAGSSGSAAAGSSASPSGADAAGGGSDAGRVDKAFLREMAPHHQMAIQMSTLAVRQAKRLQVKQLAVKIITTQGQELAQLQTYAKAAGVEPDTAGKAMGRDAKTLGLSMDEMGMSMSLGGLARAKRFDKRYLEDMIDHHEGAVRMARAERRHGKDPRVQRIATTILSEQKREITQMRAWLKDWY